jgi:iron complex outermembrane receptor protein
MGERINRHKMIAWNKRAGSQDTLNKGTWNSSALYKGPSSKSIGAAALLTATVTCLATFGASAAERARQDAALEEVIVTAQKRSQRLQDVPISISVLGSADLDKSTSEGLAQMLNRVPGIATTTAAQGGGTQLAIRGVTSGGALFNGSSPIAYYLDSVPFSLVRMAIVPDVSAYDIDRVEIMRGPQGTLYGASAQNGVVRVLTTDANVDDFEFKARTSISDTHGGTESYRGDMAINVPIIEGKLAARAVVGYQDLGGWIDRVNEEDANDARLRNARLKINAQITDNLSVGLSSWISRNEFGAPPLANDSGSNDSQVSEPTTTDYDAYGLSVIYQGAGFSIESRTGYLDFRNEGYLDYAMIGVPDTLLLTRIKSEMFSQEVILSGDTDAWRWTLGGMYREAEDEPFQWRRQYTVPNRYTDNSESFAIFGELTRLLADGRFEITAGLRYFEDDVAYDEYSRGVLTAPIPEDQLVHTRAKFDAVSPRVVLTWHPSRATTVYASYSEGFRSGFSQGGNVIATSPQFPPTDADTLKNYEIGFKGSLAGGRVTLDAAAYYIDWQDVQQVLTVNIGTPTTPINVTASINGESASGFGYEMSLAAQATDRLSLGLNFSWNDLGFDAPVYSDTVVLFKKGDRLNLSSEYTAGGYVNYAIPISGGKHEVLLGLSGSYISEQDNRIVVGDLLVAEGDAMFIGRATVSLDLLDRWSATLFVDNVTDEDGSAVRSPFTPNWNTHTRPRTVGAQFEYRF